VLLEQKVENGVGLASFAVSYDDSAILVPDLINNRLGPML
jgi:hypothetical protein